jgi:hypothetical protein
MSLVVKPRLGSGQSPCPLHPNEQASSALIAASNRCCSLARRRGGALNFFAAQDARSPKNTKAHVGPRPNRLHGRWVGSRSPRRGHTRGSYPGSPGAPERVSESPRSPEGAYCGRWSKKRESPITLVANGCHWPRSAGWVGTNCFRLRSKRSLRAQLELPENTNA